MKRIAPFSADPAPKRRAWIMLAALTVLVAVAVLAASCGGGTTATTAGAATTVGSPTSAGGAGGAQVVMKSFAFDPATVTIKAGGTVTWTNEDSVGHTVVADNGEFKSGDLANGATFSFKFDTAGTYAYHCSIHPTMTGKVVVQ